MTRVARDSQLNQFVCAKVVPSVTCTGVSSWSTHHSAGSQRFEGPDMITTGAPARLWQQSQDRSWTTSLNEARLCRQTLRFCTVVGSRRLNRSPQTSTQHQGIYCCTPAVPDPYVLLRGPDISLLKPQLQKQWHHAKNQRLGNIQIQTASSRLVWWTCDQCPCGLPHEWLTSVDKRQGMDSQCPFCANRKLCHHNSLLTVAPSVASYWDTDMNGVTADQVLAGSGARSNWLCPTCCHTWEASVNKKTHYNTGCPKCSKKSMGYTQPTLTASKHPVMVEFDHLRNQEAGLDPDKITLGSNKKVHWLCGNCPRGQLQLYMASPKNRIGSRTGCPYCSSMKACVCNSLQSLYPVLAAEWDTARNGVGPDQILPGSKKLAYWKNAEGHSMEQSPQTRTASARSQATRNSVKSRHEQQLRLAADMK